MMRAFSVTNDKGRVFNVEIVKRGESYGLSRSLIATADLVEFYDSTFANKPATRVTTGFGPLGQFVSRYYVATLLEDSPSLAVRGLCLDGGQREVWSIDGPAMCYVLRKLRGESV